MTYTYDITLVAAALCISMLAAFTGLTLTTGLSAFSHSHKKMFVSMAALALGGGIWSTHFVAMLALKLPIDIGYDPLMTLASVMVAVLLVGVALLLMHFGARNQRNIILSGLLVGAGIVSMHYVGMLAIRGCVPQFGLNGKILSGLLAAFLGIAAIKISYGRRTNVSVLAGTIVFGLSVIVTHFSSMYWTGFARMPVNVVIEPSMHNGQLAMIVTLAAFVICGAFLLSASTFAVEPVEAAIEIPTPLPFNSSVANFVTGPAGPVDMMQLSDAERAAENVSDDYSDNIREAAETASKNVPFERDNKIYFFPIEDIAAIQAEGHYTLLYGQGKKLFCPWSISTAESKLPSTMFFRSHRSYLVNTQKIHGFERRKDTGVCILKNESVEFVPVSRSKVSDLRNLLDM